MESRPIQSKLHKITLEAGKTRNINKMLMKDFSGGSEVKNSPCNAGDMRPIHCQRIKIPHAKEQLSPPASTGESAHSDERSCMMQQRFHLLQPRPNTAK